MLACVGSGKGAACGPAFAKQLVWRVRQNNLQGCRGVDFEGMEPLRWTNSRSIEITCGHQGLDLFTGGNAVRLEGGSRLRLAQCEVLIFADGSAPGLQPDPQDASGGLQRNVFEGGGGSQVVLEDSTIGFPEGVRPCPLFPPCLRLCAALSLCCPAAACARCLHAAKQ